MIKSLERKYKSAIKSKGQISGAPSAPEVCGLLSSSWHMKEKSKVLERKLWDILCHWFLVLRQRDHSRIFRNTVLPGNCAFPGKRKAISQKPFAKFNSKFASEHEEAEKSPPWFRTARQKNGHDGQRWRCLKAFLDFTCPYNAKTKEKCAAQLFTLNYLAITFKKKKKVKRSE